MPTTTYNRNAREHIHLSGLGEQTLLQIHRHGRVPARGTSRPGSRPNVNSGASRLLVDPSRRRVRRFDAVMSEYTPPPPVEGFLDPDDPILFPRLPAAQIEKLAEGAETLSFSLG